ncbi:sporulation protein YqfC [Clostridium lundense]|uniref:sporulation protein YqfC n=1 Tax=Clostridium lundense TaxID=319475 RepID=UPI000B2A6005|nr:sporulation protein YqfC [Clostridium lundense]
MKVLFEGVNLEEKLDKAKSDLAEKLDLPRDVVMDLPKIVITGNSEIIIENHKGIIVFDEKQIKINSRVGLVSIYGREFEILFLGGSTITLKGKFQSVVYEGNE